MYQQEITRKHRTAFILAIDQSQSMMRMVNFRGRTITKAAAVAYISDNIINELMLRAHRDDGIRDYYDIAVLGYSDNEVYPLIDKHRLFIPISELSNYKPQMTKIGMDYVLPDGSKSLRIEEWPSWIKVQANGNTPMYDALLQIRDMVTEWCNKPQNADSFPPIVFNITDGVGSNCSQQDLLSISEQIRSIGTSDGKVLLINIHMASDDNSNAVIFPSDSDIDESNHRMKLLAECSSIMPEAFNGLIRAQRGDCATPPFHAMSYNASLTEVITILNIGSRSITNLL